MLEQSLLTIIPLGGLGEIGQNCMLLTSQSGMVLIDCGLMFPEDHHLGVDVVIPCFDLIIQNQEHLKGIILTHGHEDHIGALPWLIKHIQADIYASPFTLALVEHKLREHELLDKVRLIPVGLKDSLALADFKFHFFPVSHSIIQGFALGIESLAGKILHTGDFKLDPSGFAAGWSTDLELFRRFANKELLLLLADSTNVERPGFSLSESMVTNTFEQLFVKAPGRVIITLFSSNLQRIQNIFDVALQTGKKIAVDGRSLVKNIETACTLGLLTAPSTLYLDIAELPDLPDEEIVFLVTGSQGEPLSALSRIISGAHKKLKVHKGDTVIMSSRSIPGNTKAVTKLIDNLYRAGAEVVYDTLESIHASGHACEEELKLLLQATKPKYFIPIHGEYRHLFKHCRLAVNCGVKPEHSILLENGQPISFIRQVQEDNEALQLNRVEAIEQQQQVALLECLDVDIGKNVFEAQENQGSTVVKLSLDKMLKPGGVLPLEQIGIRLEERIEAESILVDGKGVGDVGNMLLKERRILSEEGFVIISVILDERNYQLLMDPKIFSRGFVFEKQFSYILDDAEKIVTEVIANLAVKDRNKLSDVLRLALRRFFRNLLDRDPIVLPIITML